MKRSYWNRVARNYEDEIFNVFENDRKNLVLSKIDSYASRRHAATDFGCGIGSFLPALSERFAKVVAVDISTECIDRARADHADLSNVDFVTADLSNPRVNIPGVDFGLCVNSIITARPDRRTLMWDVVCRRLRPGGHLVLVVPSLETVLLTDFRLSECNRRSATRPRGAAGAEFRR